MVKYLMYLVFIFSVSALGAGRVSELCNINRVNKLEILNLPMFVTTQIAMNENDLKSIYKYKAVVNNMQKRTSDEIISLLKMKYSEQVKDNDIRWGVNILSDKGSRCNLYFDGFGSCGKVNGVSVCFERNGMIKWIVNKFPLFEQDIN